MRALKTLVFSALLLTLTSPVQAAEPTVTVMSRNIYLGADVGVAMELIPDFPAAAQFMWEQVKKTDFKKRAPVLAAEILMEKPDVVGVQEATTWYCKKNLFSKKVAVFNFTDSLLAELNGEYVIPAKAGVQAFNPGYSIAPVPFLTKVTDPDSFQPLFGSDSAACGFEIGDALLIKSSLSSKVLKVGNTEYVDAYTIVPTLMRIFRGYTWADIEIAGTPVRFISTHLESIWDENKVPNAAKQAGQLIADLKDTKMPTIVIGDFNSDPRDPRPSNAANPGLQPTASDECPANSSKCNAYKLLVEAGFADSGPDASEATTYTWGMNALLTGPDPDRLKAAQSMGNVYGFTDRLDYIFSRNGAAVTTSKIIGFKAPYSTDHAGVVAEFKITASDKSISPDLPSHKPFAISFWEWVGLGILALFGWLIARKVRRKRRF